MTRKIITLIVILFFICGGFFWLENLNLVNPVRDLSLNGVKEGWVKLKEKIQELVSFSPAQIVPLPAEKLLNETEEEIEEETEDAAPAADKFETKDNKSEIESVLESKPKLTLEEIQESLDDIAEKVDILNQEVRDFVSEKIEITEAKEKTEEIEEEVEKPEEKEEEPEEELEEEEEEIGQELGQRLCEKITGAYPIREKVIINEVAWMGTINSANDEWIELKNISGKQVNLIGWQLLDKEKQIEIVFTTVLIPAEGLFLLERTNDDSVPAVAADLIYNGALGNTDEALYLFDENCQLQDEVETNPNWPAGDNSSKRTMERPPTKDWWGVSWQTSLNPGGTPKGENSSGYFEYYSGGGGVQTPTLPSYPKILINEIEIESQVSEKDDFVELYNPNDEDVDLTDWYLQRKTKGANDFSTYAPKDLFSGKIIKTHNYFLIANASSTFLADATTTYPLTEDNTLVLKNPNREIVDKIGWGEAQDCETATTSNPKVGESIGRKFSIITGSYQDSDNNFEDFENQEPTPKEKNKSKNYLPTAVFTFFPQNPFANEEIIFDASSSTDPDGIIIAYNWYFGDNTTTTTNQATTTHSFSTSSDFLVSLIVVDDKGAASSPATTTVHINPQPQPILEISTISLSFFAEENRENPPNQTFVIENQGQGNLNWSISTSENWLSVSLATGTIPAVASTTVEILVNISGLATENYDATITVGAVGAQNNPKEISISLTIFTETVKTVIINEIAWMGTGSSSALRADEWIELYNNTTSTIDIIGWRLISSDGSPDITFSTSSIPVNSFYLLERTDDNTISDIPADWLGSFGPGGLKNDGEKLELKDSDGNLIDLVDCSSGWFAGMTSPDYISMERINSNIFGSNPKNWANNNLITRNGKDADGNSINGTPKSKNSVSL